MSLKMLGAFIGDVNECSRRLVERVEKHLAPLAKACRLGDTRREKCSLLAAGADDDCSLLCQHCARLLLAHHGHSPVSHEARRGRLRRLSGINSKALPSYGGGRSLVDLARF